MLPHWHHLGLMMEVELGGHGMAASDSPEGCILSPLEILTSAVT